MRYLMEDVRAAWKDGLLVLVVWVAAMLVACTYRDDVATKLGHPAVDPIIEECGV